MFNRKGAEIDRSSEPFDITATAADKIFVLGIGGGNDVVGAYAIAKLLRNSGKDVLYGSCLSKKKPNFIGFKEEAEGLYLYDPNEKQENEHHSLRVIQRLRKHDTELPPPYVLIADDGRTERITDAALTRFKGYTIITIDNGGDSITGGNEGEKGFDRRNVDALKEKGIQFIHIILGLGCDGESDEEMISKMFAEQTESILGVFEMDKVASIIKPMLPDIENKGRQNTDTTVIMVEVSDHMKNNPNSAELYTIPRHESKNKLPYSLLNKAVVFDGTKLK